MRSSPDSISLTRPPCEWIVIGWSISPCEMASASLPRMPEV